MALKEENTAPAFKLDTSGEVHTVRPGPMNSLLSQTWTWPDLSPFTQGYVEALGQAYADSIGYQPKFGSHPFRFSDLAPETLVRIMEDCGAHEKTYPLQAHDPRRRNRGFNFWRNRQAGMWTSSGWPPLTPYLGDDGKVYLREGA